MDTDTKDRLAAEIEQLLARYNETTKELREAVAKLKIAVNDRQKLLGLVGSVQIGGEATMDEGSLFEQSQAPEPPQAPEAPEPKTMARFPIRPSEESVVSPSGRRTRLDKKTILAIAKVALESMTKIGGEFGTDKLTALISESSPNRGGNDKNKYDRALSILRMMRAHGWIVRVRRGVWSVTGRGCKAVEGEYPKAQTKALSEKVLDVLRSSEEAQVRASVIAKSLWPTVSAKTRCTMVTNVLVSLKPQVVKVRSGIWALKERLGSKTTSDEASVESRVYSFLVTVKRATIQEVTSAVFGTSADERQRETKKALVSLRSKGKVEKAKDDPGAWATVHRKRGT